MRILGERPEFDLVAEAADGVEALHLIRQVGPDVAVIDVKMPGLDGLQVVNAVQRDGLSTRVVLLSAFVDGAMVFDALAAGAAAYVSKDADRRRIGDTIASVARGDTVFDPAVQADLAAEIRARGAKDRPMLSEREREVLVQIANGRSAPQIAQALFLSTATVKSHLQSLYEKLGVSDRAAAVAEAMRRGLLE